MSVKVLAPLLRPPGIRTPVRIAVVALVANMAMNLMLIFPLAHAGLALATSLASFINAGLLYRLLVRQACTSVPGGAALPCGSRSQIWRSACFSPTGARHRRVDPRVLPAAASGPRDVVGAGMAAYLIALCCSGSASGPVAAART